MVKSIEVDMKRILLSLQPTMNDYKQFTSSLKNPLYEYAHKIKCPSCSENQNASFNGVVCFNCTKPILQKDVELAKNEWNAKRIKTSEMLDLKDRLQCCLYLNKIVESILLCYIGMWIFPISLIILLLFLKILCDTASLNDTLSTRFYDSRVLRFILFYFLGQVILFSFILYYPFIEILYIDIGILGLFYIDSFYTRKLIAQYT